MTQQISVIIDGSLFIETYSGKEYHFAEPTPDMIEIDDVAHHLSHICRFTGAVNKYYSVASHSILVAYLSPPEHRLQALLHDATEAYVGDVSSPLKRLISIQPDGGYGKYEDLARAAICEKFNMEFELPREVKTADYHALYLESKYLFARHNRPFPLYWERFRHPDLPEVKPLSIIDGHNVTAEIFKREILKCLE